MSDKSYTRDEDEDAPMTDIQNAPHPEESAPIDDTTEGDAPSKQREKKAAAPGERESGKSLFPISRVQKIIKLDKASPLYFFRVSIVLMNNTMKELPIVAKDATFAIAMATEMFIQQLCEAGYSVAQGEKRSTVQPKDIKAVVRRADEFLFLEDTLAWIFDPPLTKTVKAVKAKEKEVKEKADHQFFILTCSMKVVSTFHKSSSVVDSLKCQLSARGVEHLVVAKLNALEVYSITPTGLHHECAIEIWGKICAVKAIPISQHEARSTLLVMLTHPEPELLFLSYSESESEDSTLVVEESISLFERTPRLAEFFTNVIIHPSGSLAIASCYAGKLKVLKLKAGRCIDNFDISCPEINVLSLAFTPTPGDEYSLFILSIDARENLRLAVRDLDIGSQELSLHYSDVFQPTVISNKMLPFPTDYALHIVPLEPQEETEQPFLGGALILGGRQIPVYELASEEGQEKLRGKRKRLEAKKHGKDPAEAVKARNKEKERDTRKRKPNALVEWPYSDVSAWCSVEPSISRLLIGDSSGRLSMLSVQRLNAFGLVLVPLGEISSPTTLTYLANQAVYVGSHLGDSQLIQISNTRKTSQVPECLVTPDELKTTTSENLAAVSKKGKEKATAQEGDMDVDEGPPETSPAGRIIEPSGSFVSVLDTYKNIAPIKDAILVDPDQSGQNQIVTCSGGANSGSINIIRNGAAFQELAYLPGITGITKIWAAKVMAEDSNDKKVLLSTLSTTHLFTIEDGGARFRQAHPSSIGGLVTNEPTLAFSNVYRRVNGTYQNSSLVIQVIPTAALMLEWDTTVGTYIERDRWDVKKTSTGATEFVLADINDSQVVLATDGGTITVLCVEANSTVFHKTLTSRTDSELSAISISTASATHFSQYVSVASWHGKRIQIYRIDAAKRELEPLISAKTPNLPSTVRSLLLFNFGTGEKMKDPHFHPYLVAGLADGSVATMLWRPSTKTLSDLKLISLGNAPMILTPCTVDGKKTVLASGDRSTILFLEKNRLANSSLMLKGISAVTHLNTEAFSSSLLLVSSSGLNVGTIKDLNKLHIRSLPFGLDNPTRIAHSPVHKVYGVSFTYTPRTRISEFQPSTSTFKVLDDNTLSVLAQCNMEPNEEITSVASVASPSLGQDKGFFVIGTYIFKSEEREPSAGRLLVLSVNPTHSHTALDLSIVAETQVKGCVFAIKVIEDKIVASINSAVALFRLEASTDLPPVTTYTLKEIHNWNHNYMVTSLGSYQDRLVAGDQISSVSLIKVTDTELISEARDYGPLYPMALEALDEKSLVCSNDTLNIVIFSLGSLFGREALERSGSYHLSDMVTKFIRGSVFSSNADSLLRPEMLFFTSSGRIGTIIDVVDQDLSVNLSELERNLSTILRGAGGGGHTKFRTPKDTRGSSDADVNGAYGFLDGDFLENYLNFTEGSEQQRKALQGRNEFENIKIPAQQLSEVLEQLQGFH
ncbi:hypothetical protein CVT24_010946 [Panaeolus cyanescens]|uniref:DNA damage-binding protein 1 n=1 Tax=Panaeolus cyanescens TaxID=181874 RepID=A0A409YVT5_9AGAR|nr:hypothetical protein CVT24_010946 [Panaeolus cyanescens]